MKLNEAILAQTTQPDRVVVVRSKSKVWSRNTDEGTPYSSLRWRGRKRKVDEGGLTGDFVGGTANGASDITFCLCGSGEGDGIKGRPSGWVS